MPPANPTPSSSLLDDAASAVVLIEMDDIAGWEDARVKFLADAEHAPPAVGDCLKTVAEMLTNFAARSEEERASLMKEIQRIIQTVSESLWDAANLGLPKDHPVETGAEHSPPPTAAVPIEAAPPPVENNEQKQQAGNPRPSGPPPSPPEIAPPTPVPVTAAAEPASSSPARVAGGKFLTFFLAKEEYGFEILKVHEIITLLPVTPVPRMPAHLLGVINLRGKIIPVVDLRLKLGLPPLKDQTCIIIVRAHNIEVGVSVDRVSEVANISEKDIEEVPSFGEGATGQDLLGIAKSAGHVRLLLDIDKVLAPDHLQGMAGQSLVTTCGNGK